MSVTPSTTSSPPNVNTAGVNAPHGQSLDSTTQVLGTIVGQFRSSLLGTGRSATDPDWPDHLARLIGPLREAFTEHCGLTEGASGLYAGVLIDAPRLVHAVTGLVAEHRALDQAIGELAERAGGAADWTDAARTDLHDQAVELLNGLARHRQHDADLLYEAYGTDIGGE
jgi:hypothetical protein